MNDAEKTSFLIKVHGFHPGTAAAYVKSRGYCTYCEEPTLNFRDGYSSAAIDHLIPRSLLPELAMEIGNWVFSCASCNSMKSAYNPVSQGEDPQKMLLNSREVLIQRVQDYLRPKIVARNAAFEDIRARIFVPQTK